MELRAGTVRCGAREREVCVKQQTGQTWQTCGHTIMNGGGCVGAQSDITDGK